MKRTSSSWSPWRRPSWRSSRCGRESPPAAPHWQAKKVILITIDALRRDRLGCYGYKERQTTPSLDAWCPRATVFDYAIAPAPWTDPLARRALHRSLSDRDRRLHERGRHQPRLRHPARALPAGTGFHTASFSTHALLVADEPRLPARLRPASSPDAIEPQEEGEHKMPFAKVEPLLHGLARRARHDERFFVWVHDMDTHQPPTVGNPYLTIPTGPSTTPRCIGSTPAFGRILVQAASARHLGRRAGHLHRRSR